MRSTAPTLCIASCAVMATPCNASTLRLTRLVMISTKTNAGRHGLRAAAIRKTGKMSKSPKKGKSLKEVVIPDYISKLPDVIPPGRILVHNDVCPAKRLGFRGFRAWLSFPEPRYVICDCKWASNLGKHYHMDKCADDRLAGKARGTQ
jgi:hypothetical protein